MTVSVAELSLHLAEYLARVRAGETIFVEEQDRVLARLSPVDDDTDVEKEELSDLVRRGVLRAPVEALSPAEATALLDQVHRVEARSGPDLVAAVLAEREDGR